MNNNNNYNNNGFNQGQGYNNGYNNAPNPNSQPQQFSGYQPSNQMPVQPEQNTSSQSTVQFNGSPFPTMQPVEPSITNNPPSQNQNSNPSFENNSNQVNNYSNIAPNSNSQQYTVNPTPVNTNNGVVEPTPINPTHISNNYYPNANPNSASSFNNYYNLQNTPNQVGNMTNNLNSNLNSNLNNNLNPSTNSNNLNQSIPNPNFNNNANNNNNNFSNYTPYSNPNSLPNSTPSKKKNNPVLVVIMILIIIGCIVWMIYYLSSQGIIDVPFFNNNNNVTENDNNNNSNSSIKIDDTKEYVYQAEYGSAELTATSYTLENGEEINAEDLTVPYINIKSADATTANTELKELYEDLVKKFNDNSQTKTEATTVKYSSYTTNNILSVVVETKTLSTTTTYDYYTYNFDLTTGNNVTYTELISKTNLTEDSIKTDVKEILNTYIHNICAEDSTDTNKDCNGTFDKLLETSLESYNQNVTDNSLKYYLNSDLYVVLNPSSPKQESSENVLFNINTKSNVVLGK